jgi:hypothetical protein
MQKKAAAINMLTDQPRSAGEQRADDMHELAQSLCVE